MSGAMRSAGFRGVLAMGAGLLLFATFVATPAFTQSRAAGIPFGSAAFAAQWGSIEPVVPNFWGPAVQPAQQEPYVEATGGVRTVQYFDKARMEQTTASGPVTNGLLTVELISGQRQMGDTAFAAFAPSALPVVGDITNAWPSYAALSGTIFAARIARSGEPAGTVYKADGAFALNPGLAAQPGAAYGDYQSDPGGRYAHNIPLAFSTYLAALPLPWQTAMGFPLTEPFWVNVKLNTILTWVLVQPFERRVLSYTPTNPPGFQVEMGNIGQHYYQWRYTTITAAADGPTPSATTSRATTTTTVTATRTVTAKSGTPVPLAIASVQLGTVTETTCSLTFTTSIAATTEILYGTSSHAYTSRQEISATATYDHTVDLSGLAPGTKYYFALHATTDDASIQRKEDYFATATSVHATAIAMSPTPTKDARTPTVLPTSTSTTLAMSTSTATATATATSVAATATMKATPTATATMRPTATATVLPTATPIPTATATTTVPQIARLNFNQIVVGAGASAQLAPSVVQLDSATVVFSLAADGTSGSASGTAHPTNWTIDTTNARASSVSAAPPVSVTDRQTALTISATATIPFVDTTAPLIVVTFSRKLTPSEYASGITITSTPLSNSRAPGYNVTLTFALALT